MSIIRFKNSALPSLVENFFNREASDFLEPFNAPLIPPTNILESQEGFLIEVAAPGLKKDNFQVNLNQNILTIQYQEEENKETIQGRYTRKEFRSGSFKRTFTVPQTIETEQISAQYENGILRLFLPKKEEAKPRPERTIHIN